jgi:hypothetical protein
MTMLAKNVGGLDRILRVVVGAALILGFFLNMEATYSWLYLIGIVPLATGLMRTCPLYSMIGVNTCPSGK